MTAHLPTGIIVSMDFADVETERAGVSVLDHGFLFGDSVYEVVRTLRGRLLFAQEHLARLESSAAGIGLQLPHSASQYLAEFERMRLRLGLRLSAPEAYLRLIVTRGVGELELATASCRHPVSIVIARPLALTTPPSGGVKIIIATVDRNSRRATNPAFKTGNYLNNVLALDQARAQGALEAVMLNAQGMVSECTTSNIFIVKHGKVRTPALDVGILAGVTRAKVIEAARRIGMVIEEAHFGRDALLDADEVFITSTTRDVLPVFHIGEHVVGAAKVGECSRAIQDAYRNLCDQAIGGS